MDVYALDFESGSNQYGAYATGSNLQDPAGKKVGVSFWFKAETVQDQLIADIAPVWPNQEGWYLTAFSSGRISLYAYDDDPNNYWRLESNTGIYSAGSWVHAVLGFDIDDLANAVCRINDVDQKSGLITTGSPTGISTSTTNFEVGRRSYAGGSLYLDGILDEFAVFKKVPTLAEITEWYAAGVGKEIPLATSDLLAVYRFNDGVGAVATDSKNGYNLTLYNSPSWVTGHVPGPAPPPVAEVPGFWPRKSAPTGYNCFIQQFIKNRFQGTRAWKLPDGTLW